MSGDGIAEKLHIMKQRMEVLFSANFQREQDERESPEPVVEPEPWEPAMDIWESRGAWLFTADLPGLAGEDLHVELAERQLTIRGSRKTSPDSGAMAAAQRERPAGSFSRTFTLPEDAQADSVEAVLKSGVLTVTVLRGPGLPVTPQKVKVRAG